MGRKGTLERKLTSTVEDYLQAIYSLQMEGEAVFCARLARRMKVAAPTAWAMIQRMARDGLVALDHKKSVHLTEEGEQLAEKIVRRHRLAERFLMDVLGLGWAECHEEAHRFEHAISPRLEERIVALLGNPTHCPHGSPIPGSGGTFDPELVPLSSLREGQKAIIGFISEELEEDLPLLHYLERGQLMPGQTITVQEVVPSSDLIIIQSSSHQVPLALRVAEKIRVRSLF